MGLNFSHCDARWSYVGFNSMRRRIAIFYGFAWDELVTKEKQAEFMRIKTWANPLSKFLCHSDCEGTIDPKTCKILAPILRQLASLWDENDYDRIQLLELADGMAEAGDANEKLKFR